MKKPDKNIREYFTIEEPTGKQRPYYEIRIEGDMNDGDDREDTLEFSKEEWDDSEDALLYALIAAQWATGEGYIDDMPDTIQQLIYDFDLVPFDSEYDHYAHSLDNIEVLYYDENSRQLGVDIPNLEEVFGTVKNFIEVVCDEFPEYTGEDDEKEDDD